MKIKEFKKSCAILPGSECWIWAGSIVGGYAFVKEPVNKLAHIVCHELFIGPIKEGMVVDHLCLRKRCVNPNHLKQITVAENTSRKREALKRRLLRASGGIVTERIKNIQRSDYSEDLEMTFFERIEDDIKKANIFKSWPERIKKSGVSRSKFCKKHNFDETALCKYINGVRGADWETINKIERALQLDGF